MKSYAIVNSSNIGNHLTRLNYASYKQIKKIGLIILEN